MQFSGYIFKIYKRVHFFLIRFVIMRFSRLHSPFLRIYLFIYKVVFFIENIFLLNVNFTNIPLYIFYIRLQNFYNIKNQYLYYQLNV